MLHSQPPAARSGRARSLATGMSSAVVACALMANPAHRRRGQAGLGDARRRAAWAQTLAAFAKAASGLRGRYAGLWSRPFRSARVVTSAAVPEPKRFPRRATRSERDRPAVPHAARDRPRRLRPDRALHL